GWLQDQFVAAVPFLVANVSGPSLREGAVETDVPAFCARHTQWSADRIRDDLRWSSRRTSGGVRLDHAWREVRRCQRAQYDLVDEETGAPADARSSVARLQRPGETRRDGIVPDGSESIEADTCVHNNRRPWRPLVVNERTGLGGGHTRRR